MFEYFMRSCPISLYSKWQHRHTIDYIKLINVSITYFYWQINKSPMKVKQYRFLSKCKIKFIYTDCSKCKRVRHRIHFRLCICIRINEGLILGDET